MSDKMADLKFEPIDEFRNFIWENFNKSSSKIDGYMDIEDLLETLKRVEKEVVIFCQIAMTFLHASVFEILVFSKKNFEESGGSKRIGNIRFLGLAIIHMHMLAKYRSDYEVGLNDFGWLKGKTENVAARFNFEKSFDNHQEKSNIEKEYKRVTLPELINEINKREKSLGIK
ncbi:MAG: hypothetical protein WD751_00015 [Anaerolineales bacterium]